MKPLPRHAGQRVLVIGGDPGARCASSSLTVRWLNPPIPWHRGQTTFCGRSPEPWLGPQIEEHIPTLAERGITRVVSIPVGFVSDHVEILYDIDIKAQQTAQASGIHLVRPPALNDDPLFIDTLVEQILIHSAPWLHDGEGGG